MVDFFTYLRSEPVPILFLAISLVITLVSLIASEKIADTAALLMDSVTAYMLLLYYGIEMYGELQQLTSIKEEEIIWQSHLWSLVSSPS